MYLVMSEISPYSPYPENSQESQMAPAIGCTGNILFTSESLDEAMDYLTSFDLSGWGHKARIISSSKVCKVFETCLEGFPFPEDDLSPQDDPGFQNDPNLQDVFIVKA